VKVVLCDHVDHLGERGDIVSVAPGYARNYLLPKRLAMPATPGNLRTLEHRRRVWELKEAQETEAARELAGRLAEVELAVTKKAGESGTLYGSVTSAEIAEMLSAKGIEIDRRRIVLEEPIKSVGAHEVTVKLHRDVTGQVKIEVVSEQDTE
jgi:large subunit ribosomal protein L9